MDSKKENRMNKLQTSIEKSFLLQPAIKITQYNNLNNISLDRSFNSKVGIGKEQEEFQFQKNRYSRTCTISHLCNYVIYQIIQLFDI